MEDVSNWPQHLWKHQPVSQKYTLHNPAWDNSELCRGWGSPKYPTAILFTNQILIHFWVCSSITANQGWSVAPTVFQPTQTRSPPLALTHFSASLQEALLQHCDLLLNRLSLALTHNKLSQLGECWLYHSPCDCQVWLNTKTLEKGTWGQSYLRNGPNFLKVTAREQAQCFTSEMERQRGFKCFWVISL